MSAISRRLQKLEAEILGSASEDPRWRGGLPLFVLFDGEELVRNPLPDLEPLVIRCANPRRRNGPMPERYRPYVVTK